MCALGGIMVFVGVEGSFTTAQLPLLETLPTSSAEATAGLAESWGGRALQTCSAKKHSHFGGSSKHVNGACSDGVAVTALVFNASGTAARFNRSMGVCGPGLSVVRATHTAAGVSLLREAEDRTLLLKGCRRLRLLVSADAGPDKGCDACVVSSHGHRRRNSWAESLCHDDDG